MRRLEAGYYIIATILLLAVSFVAASSAAAFSALMSFGDRR